MDQMISFEISDFGHSCLPPGRGAYLEFGLPARSRFGESRCWDLVLDGLFLEPIYLSFSL
jgi:hypothetical protein